MTGKQATKSTKSWPTVKIGKQRFTATLRNFVSP